MLLKSYHKTNVRERGYGRMDAQYSIGLMRIAAKEIGMDFLLMSELDRAMQRMQKKVTPEMAHKAYKEVFSLEVLNF